MTFTLSRADFEAKRKQLADSGIVIAGDVGVAPAYRSVTIGYAYTEPTLTLTILKKPALVPESYIVKQISSKF